MRPPKLYVDFGGLLEQVAAARNFRLAEFACKCCGLILWTVHLPVLIVRAQAFRDLVAAPVRITSGGRCERHNREIGGVSNSLHTLSAAIDVQVIGRTPKELAPLALKVGFVEVIPEGDVNDRAASNGWLHMGVIAGTR